MPPLPEWQPAVDVGDTGREQARETIARLEALLRETQDPEGRATVQSMLDTLYKQFGIQQPVPPASDEEIEAWLRDQDEQSRDEGERSQ